MGSWERAFFLFFIFLPRKQLFRRPAGRTAVGMAEGGAAWATPEVLERLFSDSFDANGFVREGGVPVLAKGTFAVVFKSEDVAGSAAAQGDVVRVAVSPPGPEQEFAFQKELQALVAYLKLTPLGDEPKLNQLVRISRDQQPSGLCRVLAYFVIAREKQRAVITIMPLGKPLIDVIEEELISASERPGEQQPRQTDVVSVGSVCGRGRARAHVACAHARVCACARSAVCARAWHRARVQTQTACACTAGRQGDERAGDGPEIDARQEHILARL